MGLVPGTLPWAAGAGGCRHIPAPNPRTLLPQFPWLCNGGGRGARLRGPCLTPPSLRGLLATGSQGLHHHGPSKGLCTTTKRLCPSLRILGVAMVTEGEKGVHLVWGGKGIPGRGHWCTQTSGQCGCWLYCPAVTLSLTRQLPFLCLGGAIRASHRSLGPSIRAGLPGPSCCWICLGLIPAWL